MKTTERHNGSTLTPLVECLNARTNLWRVRWDVQTVRDEGEGKEYVTFLEADFTHKPTIAEVRSLILAWYNEEIDEKIISGYTWNDTPVWLSQENQFNYKAAYDLAAQTDGESLPVTFKFGTDEEPVYHEFTTLAELADFYTGAMAYIAATLAAGWQTKDAIDWTAYAEALDGTE